jgi:hypothetical protein
MGMEYEVMANRLGIVRDAAGDYNTRHSKRERKLLETMREDKNIVETFQSQPVVGGWNMADGLAIASEPASALLLGMNTGKALWEIYYASIETTGTAVAKVPTVSADGLELPQDADHTDGVTAVELTHGTTSRSRAAFTVGTDADFYMEATIKVDDISDVTSMFFGWRKAEAYQADPESYDEMAAFQIGGTADGQINIWTIQNNGATTKTDTTLTDWIDAGEHTLKVIVRKNGKVEFYYDSAVPTVTQAFSFDSGEVVVPYLHLDGETGDAGVSISSWKVGRL